MKKSLDLTLISFIVFITITIFITSCENLENPTTESSGEGGVNEFTIMDPSTIELLNEFGEITEVPQGLWGKIKKWWKKHVRPGYDCNARNFGICFVWPFAVDVDETYGDDHIAQGIGLVRVGIIENQVRLQLEYPSANPDGLFPIGQPISLDANLCSEFGFTSCEIQPGLYQADMNDPQFPYGVVYVNAITIQ